MSALRTPIRTGARPASRGQHRRPSSLSATSLDAIARFVRILARGGATPQDIVRAVRIACGRIPARWAVRALAATRGIDDASHVLTVWFTELAYLDGAGRPRPLPVEGASKSLAALVRSVDRRLDAREVLAYLLHSGAVRRHGRRYVPRGRALLLRGAKGPEYFHTLRVLVNMLGTLEHNLLPKRAVPGWFEYFAENPRFPARAREELEERVNRLGKEVLSRLDAYMRRREVTRRPGEPTLRVGVGMHLWEGNRKPLGESRVGLRPARKSGQKTRRRRI
jgi:hypothetical protein